jgi:putative hydrolase of the HAD superfamily
MTKFETVFLDAGGVLVFPNWKRVADALADQGVRVDPQRLAAAEPFAKRQLDSIERVANATDHQRGWVYFDLIFDRAGVARSDRTDAALAALHEYHQRSNLWELVPTDVVPALESLRERGFRLAVVSNANGTVRALFDRVGLTAKVDAIVDSFEEGVEKPDPRLFRVALERIGAHAETTVHVGDLYHVDVVGARAAGLTPVLLDAAGLYPDVDCLRVATVSEIADAIG